MMDTIGFPELALVCIVLVPILLVAGVLLTVIPFWRICTKAGFPGPLSLLMLVPAGNLVLYFYLAFAAWPALRDQTKGGATP